MSSTRLLAISALALALGAPAAAHAGEAAGPFTKEAVARVVSDHQGEIQDCYEDALAAKNANRRQARGGRVVMSWLITPGGTVRDVKVKRTSLADKRVTTCIAGAIEAWEFPPPTRPQPVVFPFDLKPDSGLDGKARTSNRTDRPDRG
jgi:hypothetical protein